MLAHGLRGRHDCITHTRTDGLAARLHRSGDPHTVAHCAHLNLDAQNAGGYAYIHSTHTRLRRSGDSHTHHQATGVRRINGEK